MIKNLFVRRIRSKRFWFILHLGNIFLQLAAGGALNIACVSAGVKSSWIRSTCLHRDEQEAAEQQQDESAETAGNHGGGGGGLRKSSSSDF